MPVHPMKKLLTKNQRPLLLHRSLLCEVSGAANTMIRRWESVFRDYPDILTDAKNRSAVKRNIQKVKDYLQKLEDKI